MFERILTPQQRYAHLVAHLRCYPGVKVTVLKGMGLSRTALSIRGEIFAMLSTTGELLVKLPAAQRASTSLSDEGLRASPARQPNVAGWAVVSDDLRHDWLRLAEAARSFAISNSPE